MPDKESVGERTAPSLADLFGAQREILGLLILEKAPLSLVRLLSESTFTPGLCRRTFQAIVNLSRESSQVELAKVVSLIRQSDPTLDVAHFVEVFTPNGDWEPDPHRFDQHIIALQQRPIFPPVSSKELLEVLGLTIKRDEANKLLTFLCQLSAYTESSQFNVIYNAPSSTGKSYIPIEIGSLFPAEDVIELGYCSPTAFFHDVGKYVKEERGYVLDLSRKILIFLDQPHTLLLQHLRPLLSHDKKEIQLKITDKSERGGLRTKNVFIKGFPAVTFCTGNLKMDEQEATRFLLLSPETNQEKIREAIYERIRRESDLEAYRTELEQQPERRVLKQRIAAIRAAQATEVRIASRAKIEDLFLGKPRMLKPRDMRDIGRLLSLVKALALLNLWDRETEGSSITASEADVDAAFQIWHEVSESQEYNLPPYVYQLFREVIVPAHQAKEAGLTRQEVMQQHFKVYGRFLADWQLRQQILPMLETAGLVTQEPDPQDRRRMLLVPVSAI